METLGKSGAKGTVEFPHNDQIEFPPRGQGEQVAPSRPPAEVGGRGTVHELAGHGPAEANSRIGSSCVSGSWSLSVVLTRA